MNWKELLLETIIVAKAAFSTTIECVWAIAAIYGLRIVFNQLPQYKVAYEPNSVVPIVLVAFPIIWIYHSVHDIKEMRSLK